MYRAALRKTSIASFSASAVKQQKLVSPAAAVWINRFGIDSSTVKATGRSVRGDSIVTKGDVLAALGPNPTIPSPNIAEKPAPVAAKVTSAPDSVSSFRDEQVTTIRKVIASRLTESKFTVPHYYVAKDCDMSAIIALRKDILKRSPEKKVSVNDFIIRAVALALQDMPQVNAFWDSSAGRIGLQSTVDISVAVATESGLITPIVRDANNKNLGEIGSEVKELATLARSGKLAPEQYQGGSFTISNLGMFGVDAFTSIINPPQACILAVAKSENRVVFDAATSEPRVASRMTAQLSCDRRVVDDALAGQFMQILAGYLEDPTMLLL
eukprot:g3277.t1